MNRADSGRRVFAIDSEAGFSGRALARSRTRHVGCRDVVDRVRRGGLQKIGVRATNRSRGRREVDQCLTRRAGFPYRGVLDHATCQVRNGREQRVLGSQLG